MIITMVISFFIVILILLQGKGAGLGSAWGGEGQLYGTRRGVEKLLFQATIIVAVLFVAVSLASLAL